jgi:hypothetical protein
MECLHGGINALSFRQKAVFQEPGACPPLFEETIGLPGGEKATSVRQIFAGVEK